MRTLLAGERATTQAATVAHWFKLEVQNGSGTWKDVGALLGDDYVIGGSVQEDIDQPVSAASFRIRRAAGTHSLSPLVVASALNVDDTGAYAPLLDLGRLIRLNAATVAPGVTPTTEWRELWTGRIDDVTWETDPIVIHCSDLGAWLMDTQIEIDGVQYGTTPVGTALDTVLQNIANAWPSGKGVPTLVNASANAFAVTNLPLARTKVLDALRSATLGTTGDDVRFRYDASHVSRLTRFDPQRSRSTVDTTIGPTEYTDVKKLAISIADLRNVGRLSYVDSSGATLSVQSPLVAAQPTDPSVVKYGRRYFEFPTSPSITTSTQAQTLLDKVVSDLNNAPIDQEIELPFAWFVQLYDRYTFTANGDHYDQDQTLAVVSYRHDFDGGAATTSIQAGGKVVGAYADWLRGIVTFANLAPSLDVVATPGPTSYSIAYSSPTPVQLSINGGAYSAAPASPITVARPSAGSTPLSYSFRAVVDDQTVVDSIDVQPVGGLDSDTVTPDLSVAPVAVTATTQTYTASAINPKTAAAVPVLVSVKGTTATDSAGGSYADGAAPAVMTAGATLTVQRPAFATVAGASVTLRAQITGGGAETIQRSVLPQVKSVFGPSLDVVPTPGSTSYSLAYAASGGTVQLSISGGAYATAPASPIVVSRPAAGASSLDYAFRITADGQTITDSVTIPAIDKDTTSPDIGVVIFFLNATVIEYQVTASVSDGSTPTGYALISGSTGTYGPTSNPALNAMADGVEYTVPSGNVVVANRPSFGTVTQALVQFRATAPSGGSERIQRSIMNQVKTSFGPSLTVTPTVGSTSVSIAYTATGTVELSIDGGSYSAAPASPIVVTRDGSDHTYAFRATLDSQVVPGVVSVPALAGMASAAPAFDPAELSIGVDSTGYAGAGTTAGALTFSLLNKPSGTITYTATWVEQTTPTASQGVSTVVAGIADGSGVRSLSFTTSNTFVSSGTHTRRLRYMVQAQLNGNVIATSAWTEVVLNIV